MTSLELYLSRIPQSVILTGVDLRAVSDFAVRWSARLLKCSEAAVEHHPDFFCVRPINKMRQIGVDLIRNLGKNVLQSPNRAERKVCVVYEADCLQRSAANAFLKILEEPPTDTSLLLITIRPFDLLPTLRSRCWFISVSSNEISLNNERLEAWIASLRSYMEDVLNDKELNVMEIYGLLYRFQGYVSSHLQLLEKEADDKLDADELAAKKAGLDKQCVKQVFVAIEEMIGDVFRKSEHKQFLYFRWIEALEKAWSQVEVNFNAASALETFLLSLG